jgi:3-hydroxyisobutyrate dehydrogenase-like beta-hydroxyacid dehydrogenase
MLADDDAVASVVLGAGGGVECLSAGALHVSSSTISVAMSDRLAEAHAKAGQH